MDLRGSRFKSSHFLTVLLIERALIPRETDIGTELQRKFVGIERHNFKIFLFFECFYNLIETRSTCFLFSVRKHPNEKRENVICDNQY